MKRIGVWIIVASLVLATGAAARERAGVKVPETVTVAGKTLVLNGTGLREATVLNVDVYVAALFLEKRSADPAQIIGSQQVKRLDLHFVRDVGKSDITGAWTSGFKKNGADTRKLAPQIAQLNGWMTSVREGDTLSFTYVPGQGVSVAKNGRTLGTIAGDDFQRAFFAIFLGKNPPTSAVKRGLLGK